MNVAWIVPQPGHAAKQVRTTPYVGQQVHYRSYGTPGGEYPPACRAATVTHIHDAADEPGETYVALCVLNPEGLFFKQGIRMDPGVYAGVERRTSLADGAVPLITCDDLDYKGGTWHFIAHPEAP